MCIFKLKSLGRFPGGEYQDNDLNKKLHFKIESKKDKWK